MSPLLAYDFSETFLAVREGHEPLVLVLEEIRAMLDQVRDSAGTEAALRQKPGAATAAGYVEEQATLRPSRPDDSEFFDRGITKRRAEAAYSKSAARRH